MELWHILWKWIKIISGYLYNCFSCGFFFGCWLLLFFLLFFCLQCFVFSSFFLTGLFVLFWLYYLYVHFQPFNSSFFVELQRTTAKSREINGIIERGWGGWRGGVIILCLLGLCCKCCCTLWWNTKLAFCGCAFVVLFLLVLLNCFHLISNMFSLVKLSHWFIDFVQTYD